MIATTVIIFRSDTFDSTFHNGVVEVAQAQLRTLRLTLGRHCLQCMIHVDQHDHASLSGDARQCDEADGHDAPSLVMETT